jgi:ferredoxin, 2Fe-2S
LELFLAKRGDQMQGKFVLHRPHSFIEPFFRSGSVRPQNTLSFELECAALHSLDRAANVTAAIPLLRELLGQLMILPEQPSGWMLRASHAPLEDSEELLRPAASASPTDPAELLRPMREEGEKRSKGEGENSSTHNSVRITFLPQNVTVSAQHGDTLLDAALDNKIELEHDCGGNCACTTCHVLVLEGAENVSKMEEVEDDRLSTAPQRQSQSRLACQAIVRGDVVVQIPDADLWDAEI